MKKRDFLIVILIIFNIICLFYINLSVKATSLLRTNNKTEELYTNLAIEFMTGVTELGKDNQHLDNTKLMNMVEDDCLNQDFGDTFLILDEPREEEVNSTFEPTLSGCGLYPNKTEILLGGTYSSKDVNRNFIVLIEFNNDTNKIAHFEYIKNDWRFLK